MDPRRIGFPPKIFGFTVILSRSLFSSIIHLRLKIIITIPNPHRVEQPFIMIISKSSTHSDSMTKISEINKTNLGALPQGGFSLRTLRGSVLPYEAERHSWE